MAGAWIKVEHATLDKPEVGRAAEMLGISTDAVLGMFLRYFVWLDKNLSGSCPDVVRNTSRKGLDGFMHEPGFAACLEAIGWAQFDDAAWTIRITNAERHNGTPAKTRALDGKRKAEGRSKTVRILSGSKPDKTGTRLDEIRNLNTKGYASQATPATGTRLQEDWNLPADWAAWARAERPDLSGQDVERIGASFKDHWIAKPGKDGRKTSWIATWRNWIRNEARFQPKGKNGHDVAGKWWESEAGILAKGKELDMLPYPGELTPDYKARINKRLRASGH